MVNRFVSALQIKTQEQKQITLMLCTGFFMGVFIATYQVTADSLFLNRMGEYLDKAFLVAGGLGILTTGIRSEEHTSELQSRRDLVCRLLLEKKKKTIS